MNYNLNKLAEQEQKKSTLAALRSLLKLIAHERNARRLFAAILCCGVTLATWATRLPAPAWLIDI